MSTIVFELKQEHIYLLKNLAWRNDNNVIVSTADEGDTIAPVFGANSIYEAIDLILNGKPANIDPLTHEDWIEYTPEQKAEWDKLFGELPLALEIILFNGHFETGTYKARYHDKIWKKI
jgi:hypothetical protein